MKKLFFLLLLIFISLFFPEKIFSHSKVQIIEMTSSGFNPSEVTIDENSSVIFLNKDSESRWPASNTHPTHELYPEFDPRKPIAPGESWAFKPKNIGDWKYHDHLFPHMRGVITVIEEEGIVAKDLQRETGINFKDSIVNFLNKIRDLFTQKKVKAPQIALPNKDEFKKFPYNLQEKNLKEILRSLYLQQ